MEAANMKLKYDTEFTKIVQQTHIPPTSANNGGFTGSLPFKANE